MTLRATILSLLVYMALLGCSQEIPIKEVLIKYDANKVDSTVCVISEKFKANGFVVKNTNGIPQDEGARRFFLYIDNGKRSPLSIHNIGGDGVIIVYIYDARPVVTGRAVDVDSIILSLSTALNENRTLDQDAIKCGY